MTDPDGKRVVRIGMLGCGVVGGGLVKLLAKHRPDFLHNGFDLRLTRIAVRDTRKKRDVDLSGIEVTSDVASVANAPDIDLLVEVMGGTDAAVKAGCGALSRGIPLVSANKAGLARSVPQYVEASRVGKAAVGFESAAAAHIPIIEVLERSLACEEITLIKGVINGSTNYILTFMERAGCEYPAALADAAAKGFTEADPRLDVEGIDAAEKLSLLALKTFGAWFHPDQIHTEGITKITQADIRLALSLDHRIKLVAAARRTPQGLSLRVHPALIHRGELLADVDSEFNAIILEGPSFNQLTFLGKGAGQLPTASAVLNDIVRIVRNPSASSLPGFARAGAESLKLLGTDSLAFCYFVRLGVKEGADRQVLAGMGKLGLPVLSHSAVDHAGARFLGVITDIVEESRILSLLSEAGRLPGVTAAPVFIRLDKDNYRDIVEREQSAYFGASLERQPGTGV